MIWSIACMAKLKVMNSTIGFRPGERRADAEAGKAVLGDRRVDDALVAEFLQQALRDFVGALIFGDFLAHDEDVAVAAHFLGHGVAQGFAHGHGDHLGAFRNVGIGGDFGVAGACGAAADLSAFGAGASAFAAAGGADSAAFCDAAGCSAFIDDASSPSLRITAIGVLTATSCVPSATRILPSVPSSDGFHFHGRLVGLDLGDDVAGLDRVALFLEPLGEVALLHRRRQRGHENIGGHGRYGFLLDSSFSCCEF